MIAMHTTFASVSPRPFGHRVRATHRLAGGNRGRVDVDQPRTDATTSARPSRSTRSGRGASERYTDEERRSVALSVIAMPTARSRCSGGSWFCVNGGRASAPIGRVHSPRAKRSSSDAFRTRSMSVCARARSRGSRQSCPRDRSCSRAAHRRGDEPSSEARRRILLGPRRIGALVVHQRGAAQ